MLSRPSCPGRAVDRVMFRTPTCLRSSPDCRSFRVDRAADWTQGGCQFQISKQRRLSEIRTRLSSRKRNNRPSSDGVLLSGALGNPFDNAICGAQKAHCLIDLGHHAPNVNIEQIVARRIRFKKLAGFHFTTRGNDDLDSGSVDPFRSFLVFTS